MRKKPILIYVITLFIIALGGFLVYKYVIRPPAINVVKHFPFSKDNALREWKEKIFKGKVLYSIEKDDHESFVLATSKGTASALFYKIKLDMKRKPVISWKWNARSFPAKDGLETLKDAKQDDFAARVYIIFPAMFFTKTRAIEYVWAEKIKQGTYGASPYSKNLQLMVVESGIKPNGEWVFEKRDIYKDYKEIFGEEPKYDIGAIAFMTDADSTKTSAAAFYDEIKIGYNEEGEGALK